MMSDPRPFLRRLFDAAIASAQAEVCLPPFLPSKPTGRLIVLGAGKAAAAMARAVEAHWPEPLSGLVVTRYGHGVPCRSIEVVEAAHPVPDTAGRDAAARMLALAKAAKSEDTVLCLISGGGSSLMALPPDGVSLDEIRAVTAALLRSGAPIAAINCVRRHLSAVAGGRLAAAAHPAKVVTLLISDVPGDAPLDIASGPTVADPTTAADALAVLQRSGIVPPDGIRALLQSGRGESVKPGDPRLAGSACRLIATAETALKAAAEKAREAGIAVHILGDAIEGEAREVAKAMAGLVRQISVYGEPFAPPCVLLSGGETTVTVRGQGRGGRNAEFLLSLAIALNGRPGVWALAGDTDGIDGTAPVAGAVIAPDTLARAEALGLDPRAALFANDGHGFFGALGDGIVTGPTRTNVNDFRAVLVMP
jgi:glycerate 2-kinase